MSERGSAGATGGDTPYQGPEPFVEGPGIGFITSEPPPGSTLSLSGGEIAIQLRIFTPRAIPGARITGDLHIRSFGVSCLILRGVQDLAAGRTETVVIRGSTLILSRRPSVTLVRAE